MSVGRRKRALSDEERVLWQKVAESIEPLKRSRRRSPAPDVAAKPEDEDKAPTSAVVSEAAAPLPPPPPKKLHRTKAIPTVAPKPPAKPSPPSLAPIDARTKRKIARGVVPIEERIDLHGLTQRDAYAALRGFIASARHRGLKVVLVITGKGRRGDSGHLGHDVFSPGERGVLRRLVPQWLSLPDMRDYVVGFEEAHIAHGGGGAIYVRLRASKTARPDPGEEER
jgi:DNA-nicking Smr family endonuclease